MEERRNRDGISNNDKDKEMKDGCEKGLIDWFLYFSLSFSLSRSLSFSFLSSTHSQNKGQTCLMNKTRLIDDALLRQGLNCASIHPSFVISIHPRCT